MPEPELLNTAQYLLGKEFSYHVYKLRYNFWRAEFQSIVKHHTMFEFTFSDWKLPEGRGSVSFLFLHLTVWTGDLAYSTCLGRACSMSSFFPTTERQKTQLVINWSLSFSNAGPCSSNFSLLTLLAFPPQAHTQMVASPSIFSQGLQLVCCIGPCVPQHTILHLLAPLLFNTLL